jgi:DNA-binding transcriptional MerR regulator
MSYGRAKRYIKLLQERGLSSSQIAEQLNLAGVRQPGNRRLFDARAVDDTIGRNRRKRT